MYTHLGISTPKPFGSVVARDWFRLLTYDNDDTLIKDAFDWAIDNYFDEFGVESLLEAVAAAEVVAHLLGKGTQHDVHAEGLRTWAAASNLQPSDALRRSALTALRHLTFEHSALLRLWQDDPLYQEWLNSIASLCEAIGA